MLQSNQTRYLLFPLASITYPYIRCLDLRPPSAATTYSPCFPDTLIPATILFLALRFGGRGTLAIASGAGIFTATERDVSKLNGRWNDRRRNERQEKRAWCELHTGLFCRCERCHRHRSLNCAGTHFSNEEMNTSIMSYESYLRSVRMASICRIMYYRLINSITYVLTFILS